MLDSLHRRPRGRAWAEALAVLTNGRGPAEAPRRAQAPRPSDRAPGCPAPMRDPPPRRRRGRPWAGALAGRTNGGGPGPPPPARPGGPPPDARIDGARMANRAPAYRE